MPGAYEKQMTGPRYDRMVQRVKECRAMLMDETKHKELTDVVLPLLLVEVGDDKRSVEEFCYAEGLHVMCEIMEKRPSCPTLGDISIIVNELSALLCIEHNPFDDDIGVLPLLVYFLCERHKYYVDINWMSHELTFMKTFINAVIAMLNTPSEDTQLSLGTRLAAINLLYMSLLTFPPHRVVAQTAECFHTEGCTRLVTALKALPVLKETAKNRRRLAQLLASITFFGLGLQLTWELTHSQLLYATSVNLGKDLRCPCGRCEFHRRLQKVARDRDEFGVIKANDSKRGICIGFILGDGMDEVLRVLKTIAMEFRRNKSKCTFEPLIPPGTGKRPQRAKEDRSDSTDDSDNEDDMSEDKSAESSANGTLPCREGPENDVSEHDVAKLNISGAPTEQELQRQKDRVALKVNDDDPRLDDEARQLCSWVTMLCSWPYQRLHGRSILTLNNYELLAAMLSAIDLSDLRRTFDVESCTFLPGVRTTLEVVSTLILQADPEDRGHLLARSLPTMEALLRRTSEKLVDKCGPLSEGWRPCMGHYAPLLCGMIQQIYLATSMSASDAATRFSTRKIDSAKANTCGLDDDLVDSLGDVWISNEASSTVPSYDYNEDEDDELCPFPVPKTNNINRATFKAAVAACQTLLDGYEYLGVDLDPKIFLCSLISTMAVLVDTMAYIKIPERRRRFLAPPDVMCGWMANGGRKIHHLYSKLCPDDGCVFVRETANHVILRAEKASALIPAELGDPAEKLRLAVIDHVNRLRNEGLWGIDEEEGDEVTAELARVNGAVDPAFS